MFFLYSHFKKCYLSHWNPGNTFLLLSHSNILGYHILLQNTPYKFRLLDAFRWIAEKKMVACVSILIHLGKRNQSWLNYKGMGETEDQVKFTVVLFY